jgi:lambda family phage portal protein
MPNERIRLSGHKRNDRQGIISLRLFPRLNFFKKTGSIEEASKNSEISENIPKTSNSLHYTGGLVDSPFFSQLMGFSGERNLGNFGTKKNYNNIATYDYFALRTLSRQLFVESIYAAQIVGRLSTNIINEGLKLESVPSQLITGFNDDQAVQWATETEELFNLWAEDKACDWEKVHNFSALQKTAFEEALIEGDVLLLFPFDKKTKLPTIRIISGRHVRTMSNSNKIKAENTIVKDGVEIDIKTGEHIAYHVNKASHDDSISFTSVEAVRIPIKGPTSSRDVARLLYFNPPPAGKTRGTPVFSRILQPLNQLSEYSEFELEAAKINAALAVWMKKTQDKPGTSPFLGAVKKTSDPEEDIPSLPKSRIQGGMIIHELQHGEEPTSFDSKRPNVNFKNFRDAVLEDIASSVDIPPESLKLMFTNSFAASRQAIVEFRAFITKARKYFSDQFNKPYYAQWLRGMIINDKIKARGFLEGIKNNDIFVINGWTRARFTGFIKQNVDIFKEARAYKEYIDEGLITRDQAATELTGADFITTIKRLRKENKLLSDAREDLMGEINTSRSVVSKEETENNKLITSIENFLLMAGENEFR